MKTQFAGKTIHGTALGVVFLMACGLLTGCLTGCFTGELHAQLPSLPAVPPAIQGPPLPVGAVRVISESGRVSWVRSGGDLWAVSEGDVIQPGKEIVAEADGHALLELSDHSRVEVFPNSRLTFHAGGGTWKDLLEITLGKVRIHIEKIGGLPNLYKMFSPTAIIAVRGTTFDVEVDASSTTIVEVEEGQVSVVHKLRSGKEVFLNPGESLTIYANEPIAQSQVDKVRTATKIIVNVAERVVEIMRQVAGAKLPVPGTPAGGTASTTTTTSTPTATVGTGTSAGSGTSTPPSNGRGNGSGNNGDTNPGTPVSPGTGSPGGGSTGSGGANAGSTSVGATTQSRKP